jgi:hypothetical protein
MVMRYLEHRYLVYHQFTMQTVDRSATLPGSAASAGRGRGRNVASFRLAPRFCSVHSGPPRTRASQRVRGIYFRIAFPVFSGAALLSLLVRHGANGRGGPVQARAPSPTSRRSSARSSSPTRCSLGAPRLAAGESGIKGPSPLNVRKDTSYDHSCDLSRSDEYQPLMTDSPWVTPSLPTYSRMPKINHFTTNCSPVDSKLSALRLYSNLDATGLEVGL